MIRVAALTSGRTDPASRFRVRQHVAALREHGVEVREHAPLVSKYARLPGWPAGVKERYALPYLLAWQGLKLATRTPGIVGSWRADVTWLQRPFLEPYFTLERALGRPVVLDVDDAIWLMRSSGPSHVRALARHVDVVVAGNEFLADWFRPHARDVRVVPTAIDTSRFAPPAVREDRGRFVLGWTGSAPNLTYLDTIATPLARILDRFPDAQLLVVSDRAPSLRGVPEGRVEFVRWSPEVEAAAVQRMDVGLMPLPDDDWSRGKCSFKMLQYMACGVPVVVSPVGMNRDVLALGDVGVAATTDDEWYAALESLRQSPERRREQGVAGRAAAERHYGVGTVAARLAAVFRDVAPR